ncbi:MAG: hypothetical protein GY867_07760 [bacterium]|nr:hypothetical protein [bacterium]
MEATGLESEEQRKATGRELRKGLADRGWKRILVDYRRIEHRGTLTQIYYQLEGGLANFDHRTRWALVSVPEAKQDVDFIETVARNRGYIFRGFMDTDEAIEWLTEA